VHEFPESALEQDTQEAAQEAAAVETGTAVPIDPGSEKQSEARHGPPS
jgi:hypothetical protein